MQSELKDIKTTIELSKNTVNANNTQNASIIHEIKNSITEMASSVSYIAEKFAIFMKRKLNSS